MEKENLDYKTRKELLAYIKMLEEKIDDVSKNNISKCGTCILNKASSEVDQLYKIINL